MLVLEPVDDTVVALATEGLRSSSSAEARDCTRRTGFKGESRGSNDPENFHSDHGKELPHQLDRLGLQVLPPILQILELESQDICYANELTIA